MRLRAVHFLWPVALALPIALLPLPIVAGALVAVCIGVFSLLDPTWGLYALILSVPVQELVALPGGLSVSQAALLLGIGVLALHTLARPELPLPLGRLFWPIALFVWCLALTAALTPYSRAEALRELLRWSTLPLVYLLALRSLWPLGADTQPVAHWRLFGLLACLLVAPAADALLGLVQFFLGIGPPSFAIGGGHVRAYGTIGQPNSFAGYMNQAWPLALGLALCALGNLLGPAPQRKALRVLVGAGVATGLLLAGLAASFSRGGWVGALGGAAAMLLASIPLLGRQLRPIIWRIAGVALAGGLLLLALGGSGLLPTALEQRLGSITANLRIFDVRGVEITPENFAVVERMAHLQAGWNMFVRHPVTGVGPGNYSVVYNGPLMAGELPYTARPWYVSRGHAHNYYLHIAAEAGLLGAAAYLLLIGATGWAALRAVRRARGWLWRGVAIGGAGVVGAVAVHNLFENLHVLNMGLQLGTIWALLVLAERSGQG